MAGQLGWPMSGMLGIYYDDPRQVPEEELRSKACAIVTEGFDPKVEGVEAFTIPGGQHAVHRHLGSYSKLGDAWMALYSEELPAFDMDDNGSPFEIYRNTPMDTAEDDLVTDLHVPVKSK